MMIPVECESTIWSFRVKVWKAVEDDDGGGGDEDEDAFVFVLPYFCHKPTTPFARMVSCLWVLI